MAQGAGGCGLVVVLAMSEDESARTLLSAVLDAAPVATVIVEPDNGGSFAARHVQPLIVLAQKRGVATLLAGDADLARTLKADGAHIAWSPKCETAYRDAREALGSRFILGADAASSRDDAMTLGELGADYVAFGVQTEINEQDKARERRLDMVAWWAEIFEVPCVALDVASAEEAGALAAAGADFVAVRLASGENADTAAHRVAAIAEAAGIRPVNA